MLKIGLIMWVPIITFFALLEYGEEWFNVGPLANFGIAMLPVLLFAWWCHSRS